jgi:hypothetical protein
MMIFLFWSVGGSNAIGALPFDASRAEPTGHARRRAAFPSCAARRPGGFSVFSAVAFMAIQVREPNHDP